MRKDFGAKPWSYPQPVFIVAAYDEDEKPNAMNAAWGGISDTTQVSLCLSSNHRTVKNLQKTKAFTINIADTAHVLACDYIGLVSGNKVPDKVAKAGFTVTKSTFVNAPVINELAMALECKLIRYDSESGFLLGEIVNVSIDESVLTKDGKTDMTKFEPIVFDPVNAVYRKLGEKVGKAFKDGRILIDRIEKEQEIMEAEEIFENLEDLETEESEEMKEIEEEIKEVDEILENIEALNKEEKTKHK